MARILVTGGSGFIGRNLLRVLRESGRHEPVAIPRGIDLRSGDAVRRAFREAGAADYIIHAADKGGDARWAADHAATQFMANALMAVQVLQAWRECLPDARFVGLGSVWAYPEDVTVVDETRYWDGRMHPPTEHYGIVKKLLGVGIRAMCREHGMRGTMLVLGTVYGPDDTSTRSIPSLIKRMRQASDRLDVWGSPDSTRDFVYVDDQIEGILRHLDYDGELLNVSSGVVVSLGELVSTLARVMNYTGAIGFSDRRDLGVSQRRVSVARATASTGWPAGCRLHTLEEGLRKTVAAIA